VSAAREEGIAFPKEAHQLVATRHDRLVTYAEQRVKADAKRTDALRIGVALGDAP